MIKIKKRTKNEAFGGPKMNKSKMHLPSDNTARPQQCHLTLLMQRNALLHSHPRMISVLCVHPSVCDIPLPRRLLRSPTCSPKAGFQDRKLDRTCDVIYEICSAQGYKNMVKSVPHAARDLQAVYVTLISLDGSLWTKKWRTHYLLLLWLGVLMLNPFDINSIVDDGTTLVAGIVQCCTEALNEAGPSRQAAAFCMSTTLTRQDVSIHFLVDLVHQTSSLLADLGSLESQAPFAAMGAIQALAAIYKRGDRALLRNLADRVFEAVRPCLLDAECSTHRVLKHFVIKLVARLGIAVLKPRSASWCYTRGRRNLMMDGFESCYEVSEADEESGERASVGVEDKRFKHIVESAVGVLLQATCDSETKIRWSAAKGIARIASRLPRGLADDIVKNVLSIFTDAGSLHNDNAWHGSCLALAELGRLGILLPRRLPESLSALEIAIRYEVRHGSRSVGANVRDAACYVAWAFARAYPPCVLGLYLPTLIEQILMTAVFDREVHVRRAAGAALQENVGRQGIQAFGSIGIKLTQTLSFSALGSCERAYIELAPAIAKMGYWEAAFAKLLRELVGHWDTRIRILSAKSLYALVNSLDDRSLLQDVARRASLVLAPLASGSRDLAFRHGALLALAHVMRALRTFDDNHLSAQLSTVVPSLESARLYRGRDGDLVRIAACSFIAALASCSCPLNAPTQLRLLGSLDVSSGHALEAVRTAAAAAVRVLSISYFGAVACTDGALNEPGGVLLSQTVFKYLNIMRKGATASTARGSCNCLGALPECLVVRDKSTLDAVFETLIVRAWRFNMVAGEKDAETRSGALGALKEIVTIIDSRHLVRKRALKLHASFVHNAARDFSLDKRGDVGSWCRICGLQAAVCLASVLNPQCNVTSTSCKSHIVPCLLKRVASITADCGRVNFVLARPFLNLDSIFSWGARESQELCCALLRHLSEKLDSVRKVSLQLLPLLFKRAPAVPMRNEIAVRLFANRKSTELPTRLCACLQLDGVYHSAILSGLIQSAGSRDSKMGTLFRHALVRHAMTEAKSQDNSDTFYIAKSLVLKTRSLGSRVSKALSVEERNRMHLPLLRCLTVLIEAGALNQILQTTSRIHNDPNALGLDLVSSLTLLASHKHASDVKKICAAVDALLAYLSAAAVSAPVLAHRSLATLLQCLHSPYPRIRAYIAEQVYARLVELSMVRNCFVDMGPLSAAQELLCEINWGAEVNMEFFNDVIFRLCHILMIEKGHIQSQEAPKVNHQKCDELESYAYLVRVAGY